MALTPAEVQAWMKLLATRAQPLMIAGPDPTGKEYFLVVGKNPQIVGEGAESVVGLNRLQALNLAAQLIQGFAAEARVAGSAEFMKGVRTSIAPAAGAPMKLEK